MSDDHDTSTPGSTGSRRTGEAMPWSDDPLTCDRGRTSRPAPQRTQEEPFEAGGARRRKIGRWQRRWESLAREGALRIQLARNYGSRTEERAIERLRIRSNAAGYWSGWLRT